MKLGQCREMRWVRSFLVAALTACSAGLAHADGGGHRAPLGLLILLTVLGAPAMYALSGRRWRFGHLAAVMGLTQVALHAAMTSAMPMNMAGSCDEHLGIVTSGHAPAGAMTPTMLLFHIGTTIVLAAVLAYGERLLDWTIRWFFRIPRRGAQILPTPRPMPVQHRFRLTSALPRAPCGSRAPPLAFVISH